MPSPPKAELEEVVKIGHAEVLSKPPVLSSSIGVINSRIVIVVDPRCPPETIQQIIKQTGIYPVSLYWIIDCMTHYSILDITKYQIQLLSNNDPCLSHSLQHSLAF